MTLKKVKGYKVTDCSRVKKIGIACSSLKEVIEKGCKKLLIDDSSTVTVHLQDATIVDNEEYFSSLPAQTMFILRKPDEYIPTGADLIYNALTTVNVDILRAGNLVQQFFDEKIKEKIQVLCSAVIDNKTSNLINGEGDSKVHESEDKTKLSKKEEDPDWFVGLETNARTKEQFMFKRSQDRIRSYFYKTQLDIRKLPNIANDIKLLSIIDNVFNSFKCNLMKDQYFGCYLDRSHNSAMCDKHGEFTCRGIWKEDCCLYKGFKQHLINPYASREERILFSTWNLDHCIERSRTIVPALVDATILSTKKSESYQVNHLYFYTLLFTSKNLRLVHIVCHDKSKHDTAVCDNKKYLIPIDSIIK